MASEVSDTTVEPDGNMGVTISAHLTSDADIVRRRWSAEYETGVNDVPVVSLTLLATSIPRISLVPNSFPPLEIIPGESVTFTFQLVSRQPLNEEKAHATIECDSRTMTIKRLASRFALHDDFQQEVQEYRATVLCPDDDPVINVCEGREERILIRQGTDFELKKAIYWSSKKTIDVSPASIFIRGAASLSIEKSVHLRSNDVFAIKSIVSSDPRITIEATLDEPATNHRLRCVFNNAEDAGTTDDTTSGRANLPRVRTCILRLMTTHKVQSEIRIPVYLVRTGNP